MTLRIPIGQGFFTVVDDDDADLLAGKRWYLFRRTTMAR